MSADTLNLKEILRREAGKVIFAAVPVYAYAAAYLFQTSYYGAFGIPNELVRVRLSDPMTIQYGLIFLVLAMLFLGVPLFMVTSPPPQDPLWRRLAWLLPLSGFVFFLFVMFIPIPPGLKDWG